MPLCVPTPVKTGMCKKLHFPLIRQFTFLHFGPREIDSSFSADVAESRERHRSFSPATRNWKLETRNCFYSVRLNKAVATVIMMVAATTM